MEFSNIDGTFRKTCSSAVKTVGSSGKKPESITAIEVPYKKNIKILPDILIHR